MGGKARKHSEFVVKHLFEAEYKLYNDVFEKNELDAWMGGIPKIAALAVYLDLFDVGGLLKWWV